MSKNFELYCKKCGRKMLKKPATGSHGFGRRGLSRVIREHATQHNRRNRNLGMSQLLELFEWKESKVVAS